MPIVSKVDDLELELSNLEKPFWPQNGYTKGNLLNYYYQIAEYILPHLANRPIVMQRFPDGIDGKSFYQKECPDYAPDWVQTLKIASESGKREYINFCLCNNTATLLWLVNQGCIEMHPWLSTIEALDNPTSLIFDLDPNTGVSFQDTVNIAFLIKELLHNFNLQGYPKLSGATGIHIYVPVELKYTYQQVRRAAEFLAQFIVKAYPDKATIERKVKNRGKRVYIDCLQNVKGKTIASVYSVRPRPGAPVSMPVTWIQLAKKKLVPSDYYIENVPELLRYQDDLYRPLLKGQQNLDHVLELLT